MGAARDVARWKRRVGTARGIPDQPSTCVDVLGGLPEPLPKETKVQADAPSSAGLAHYELWAAKMATIWWLVVSRTARAGTFYAGVLGATRDDGYCRADCGRGIPDHSSVRMDIPGGSPEPPYQQRIIQTDTEVSSGRHSETRPVQHLSSVLEIPRTSGTGQPLARAAMLRVSPNGPCGRISSMLAERVSIP